MIVKLIIIYVISVQKIHNVNFLFTKLGAGAVFPDLLPNNILIEMWDGSTFGGVMQEIGHREIPNWMNPQIIPEPRQGYHVYLETINHRHYMSNSSLEAEEPRKLLASHKRFHHLPIFADLRLGNDTYATAKDFQVFDVNHGLVHLLSQSRIYVATPEGPIVTAMLKKRPSSY